MKFGLSQIWTETPVLARKIGYACLSINGAITLYGLATGIHWLSVTACITGIVGKVLSDLFAVDEKQGTNQAG